MDCDEIKRILPKYFQHQASDDEIKMVEEHLCVCHECRATLGEIMDKLAEEEVIQPQKEEKTEELQIISPESPEAIAQEQTQLESDEESYLTKLGKQQRDEEEEEEKEKEKSSPLPEKKQPMEYFPAKDIEKELTPSEKPPRKEEQKHEPKPSFTKPPPQETITPPDTHITLPPIEEPAPMSKDSLRIPQDSAGQTELHPEKETAFSKPEPLSAKETGSREEPKFSLASQGDYAFDKLSLDSKKVGILEYVILAIGVVVFIFVIGLLLKG